MRTFRLIVSLLLSLLLCAPVPAQGPAQSQPRKAAVNPDPKRAQKYVDEGDKASSDGKFDEALASYEEAARYAPREGYILERAAALRSKLVRAYVEAAEREALAGRLTEATEALGTALQIDPGNTVVEERLAQIKAMDEGPRAKHPKGISGLPRLQPQPGKHNLNLRGDTKTVYEQLASTFGVKTTFDPDITVKNVQLHIGDVDFSTAISVLATQTGTFWRPVNATLLFVAPDTPEKRRQFAMEAEQTFPLPAAVGPEDVTEMLRVLRDITGATRIDLDTRSHTITMRDTPEHLALAGELLDQLERARGEIVLEIELLEVDRNKARALGITPPASAQIISLSTQDLNLIKSSTTLTNLLTNIQQVFAGKGFSSIPSVVPIGGGLSTFLLTLPTGVANFSDSLSLVQSGRQVLMRAQDGKPATFFVGDRFPITLSLLSGSVGSSVALTGLPPSTIFPETSFTVGANPSALVANGFTGGTLPDLAVVFKDAKANTFVILQNQDNGNFVQVTPSPITLGSNETGQVAIGTGIFRTDGKKFSTAQAPDVVLVNSTSNNVSVLLGSVDANDKANGLFTEAPGSPFAVGKNPSSVIVADFNGDGFLDLAVANEADNTISLFRGSGDGTFTEFPVSPFKLTNTSAISETAPVAMVSGNFRNKINTINNGPEVDLAVVNQGSNNVSILLSSVDSNLNVTLAEAPNSPIAVGTTPVAIATGDLNADGVPDLTVVNQGNATVSGSVSVLLGSTNLDGTFTAATGSPLATATTPAGIVIANFANGTVPDIAVTNKGSSTVGVYLGLGGGTFASRIELNTPPGPSALIASILTTSGLPDIALVSQDPAASQGEVTVIQDSTNFANSSTVGSAQTPYPASEYVDLGVKIKATPTLHPNNEVTLLLEFEIRALAGSSVNGIPVLSNRTLTQTVRVKEDEPTLIGGLTDTEETRSITGLPGFAEIPAAGYLFGGRKNSLQDTELLIVVTPRRVRTADHLTKAIFAGRGDPGGRGGASPGGLQPQPQVVPPSPPPQAPVQRPPQP
ncbi:MAG TPA: FG-GAP-like repeat-containing protein [Candidatus Acidoferrum sp.]|nr:FG-GAP-like repeat-containing protein [Candidatus Acidoferrum sp.]